MRIELKGINELLITIEDVKGKEKELPRIVQKNGAEMQASANRYAPVDTGYLKRNISKTESSGGLTATVTSSAFNRDFDYAIAQEYGTRYQSGTPHVKPAFNDQKDKFINDIKGLLK